MSRANPNQTLTSPAQRYFQWSGGAENEGTKKDPEWIGGRVTYYDKESEETVEVPLPFVFIVLDDLHGFGGFNQAKHMGYYGNVVRDYHNGILTVKDKDGVVTRGTWAEIKTENRPGLKYEKKLFIAYYNDEKELVIGHIGFSGAALKAYIEFSNQYDVDSVAIALTGADGPHKNGTVDYFIPTFEAMNISDATEKLVKPLVEEYQAYIQKYLNQTPSSEAPAKKTSYATNEDELNGKLRPSRAAKEVGIEDVDDDESAAEAAKPKTAADAAKKAAKPVNIANVQF